MIDRIVKINEYNSNIKFRTTTLGLELKLVEEFVDYKIERFEKRKTNNKLVILSEPQIESSFPDIIFAEYDERNFENWNESRKYLDDQDLKILYHLYNMNGLDAKDIVRQLGVTYSALMRSVEKLIDSDLIERKNKLWNVVNKEDFFAIKKIETVEAKINQWDSALKQAIQNTRFSSECYVLSNPKGEISLKTIERFNEFGIGVYLKENNEFKKISKAKKNDIPNSYTSLKIGELIGRTVNS
jgi:predicted transcriptional regulator